MINFKVKNNNNDNNNNDNNNDDTNNDDTNNDDIDNNVEVKKIHEFSLSIIHNP